MEYNELIVLIFRPGKALWQSTCDSYDDSDKQRIFLKRTIDENFDDDNSIKRLRQWY